MSASIWAPSLLTAAVLNMTVVTATEWGAAGNGITDDTIAINNAMASSYDTIFLDGDHLISSNIIFPVGGKKKLTALSPETGRLILNANTFTGSIATSTGRGVYINGATGGGVFGISITMSTYTDNLDVIGIDLEGCTDVQVKFCDIFGFSKAEGLVVINTCVRCTVDYNKLHDCTTNSATNGQITGVNVDDNKISDIGSKACSISYNRIYNLNVGAAFQTAFNYQTDAINIQRGSTGFRVVENIIDNVGEGIDIFCNDALISGNQISNCFLTGIKVIHGASRNEICGNKIRRCDYYGIQVAGSNIAGVGNIEGNHIHGNSITEMDPNNRRATTSAACIETDNPGYLFNPVNNLIQNNYLDPLPNGYFAIYRGSSGTGNAYVNNRIAASGITARIGTGGLETGRVLDAFPTEVRAYFNAVQSIPSAVTTKLVPQVEAYDTRNEFSAGTLTVELDGKYEVKAQVRFAGLIAGVTQVQLTVRRAGTVVANMSVVCNGTDECFNISTEVEATRTQTIEVYIYQDSGASRNITGAEEFSQINIRGV